MRKTMFLAFLLLTSWSQAAKSQNQKRDADWAQGLAGKWHETVNINGIVFQSTTVYIPGDMAGGRWVGVGTTGQLTVNLTGTWKVVNGHVHVKVETSTHPQLITVGLSTALKILDMTETEFIYREVLTGKSVTAIRGK